MAMTLYLIRLDGTFARIDGVVATPTFENLTGKSEPYRNIFQTVAQTTITGSFGPVTGVVTFPGTLDQVSNAFTTLGGDLTSTLGYTQGTLSDEAAGTSPRQADQLYTMWKFDLGLVASTPQYLYAEFRRGDIIGNNAPNTDPTA